MQLMSLAQNAAGNAAAGAFIIIVILIALTIAVFMIVSMWMVFEKAGQPGWGAIIPIYNTILMLQIAGKPIWWIILMFIPFVSFIVYIIMLHGISTNFGRGVGTTLGFIFLPFIFWPILAFGSAEYSPCN